VFQFQSTPISPLDGLARRNTISDQVGNERYVGPNKFLLKMFVNNPLEDTLTPEYVDCSLRLNYEIDSLLGNQINQKSIEIRHNIYP
jgi:hypothetical protein